jgi:hypothetical protein
MSLSYPYTGENGETIEVTEFTQAEWEFRDQTRLAAAGVTYEELRSQAHRGYFDSCDLHMLWIMMGGDSRDR